MTETLPATLPRGRPSPALRARALLRTSGLEARVRLGLWALGAVLRGRGEAAIERSARSLAIQLGALKGAFAKAGQFASLRYDMLPASAHVAFAALQDRVPPLSFETVRATIEAELGGPLEAHFGRFEADPLAAASVAQVHRATTRAGTEVAVKVQYPWLEGALPGDLRLIRGLLERWTRRSGLGGVDLDRLMQEFALGLSEELDFRREARSAAEIAANLADDPQVAVPRVIDELSTRRVLTMHFVPAFRIDDTERLAALGVRPGAVLEVLTRAYAKQVFGDGLFHADPHPGNLFVIDEPTIAERPRVLFVDFGLSRRLAPELRRALREAILALLQRDLTTFVDRMEAMQMIAPGARPQVERSVSEMFDHVAKGGGALALGGSQLIAVKDRAKQLLRETPGLQLPQDLLLYARTLSYLFALGERLDPQVDLMKLSLPHLLRFLTAKDEPSNDGAD